MADEKPDTAAADDAQAQADFGSGFTGVEGKTAAQPTGKPDKPEPAATPRAEATPAPEYVQITAKDWADVRAAAAKTASYDQQLSKAFGTIGNLQKLVNGFQAQTPAGRKIEIPKDAFAAMERDFPELAQQTRAALEAALSGLPGTGANDVDPGKIETMLASYTSRREIEALEDAYPEWRKIVGAVDVTREQPDPNNPFRKWLSTKDVAYQNRVNGSESAAVIGRAIRTFQNETKAVPKLNGTTPRDIARADRIRSAVQPRGDNAGAAAGGKSDDDMFEEGFRSR
jgi:hypothetical protein